MSRSEDNFCRINDPESSAMDKEINWIVENAETIAVVGLSPKPQRPSNQVAKYLKEAGYTIIPVRPGTDEILGEKAYPDLESVEGGIDLVLIFRRSELVAPIVAQAIKLNAKAVWMQEGIVNQEAAEKAKKMGLKVVMDRCMSKEVYRRRLK
ncbi:MAG: CoA-binding protein [bacterium]